MSRFNGAASWPTFLVSTLMLCSYACSSMAGAGATLELQPMPTAIEQLERTNFLVGVASVGMRLANGTQCGQELELFLKAIAKHDLRSLKVIDSFGSAPKTFTWGNYYWFAAKELCDDLNTPFSISFSDVQQSAKLFNVTSMFPLRFWMVYFKFSTPLYIDLKLPFENLIHLGLCLPQSCLSADIFKYSDIYFKTNTFDMQRNFKLEMNATHIKTPEFKWSFFKQTGSIVFISITAVMILLGIIAELMHKSKTKLIMQQQLHRKSNTIPEITTMADTNTKSSKFEEFLLCFRMSENYTRILSLEKSSNYLSVVAGLRTIICLWVTVFHVYYYSLYAISNTPMIFAKLENLALQPVMQSCFYVDVFFVISAFLLVFNFLSNEDYMRRIKENAWLANLRLFMKTIFHRYMRLTPVLIIAMLLSDMVFDFLNMFSPFHLDVHSGIYCKQNWWYNLLYLQNFLDMKNICCSWTWYLGCEMQFFVLTTALLFLYARNEKLAKIIFVLFSSLCLLTSFICNYLNNITFQIDVVYSTLDQLYVKPWVRITPYIGGALLGWLLHGHKDQRTKPGRTLWQTAFWLCFVSLYLVTNFMTYWRSTPTWLVAAIMSFGKFLFALWVGGVVVMCAWGRGGIFDAMLSARPFLFLNKFCFSIYMIAPVIVIAMFGLRLEATSFTEVGSGADFLAVLLLSIATAFLIVLLLELPMQRVTSKFLKKC